MKTFIDHDGDIVWVSEDAQASYVDGDLVIDAARVAYYLFGRWYPIPAVGSPLSEAEAMIWVETGVWP